MVLTPRATHATMATTAAVWFGDVTSQSQKRYPELDCRLQLACMKLESLVIAHQQWRGEYVPDLYTPPAGHGSRADLEAAAFHRKRVEPVTGVTR